MKKILVVILILLVPVLGAKELVVGVGKFEPFFIEKGETGVFIDIAKAAFDLLPQHHVKFVFMSNERIRIELDEGNIDAGCNIFKESNVKAFLSVPLFRYTDVAVSFKKKNLSINSVAELAGKSIAAYQGATDLLGMDFRLMAEANRSYSEHSKPFVTTNLLVNGSKDVRIGDIFIFLYDINRPLHKREFTADDFSVHYLWPDVYSHVGFREKSIRDEFDQAVKQLQENGVIDAIYHRYEDVLRRH